MSKARRVLIIEDEMINARYIEESILNFFEVEIDICNTYEKADNLLKKQGDLYDLMFVDVHLKAEKDGIDLMISYADLKPRVIFVTAHSDKHLILKAKDISPLGYMIKPIDENQLKVLVDLYLVDYKPEIEKEHDEFVELLTQTEFKVCCEIALGLSSSAIGDKLSVSVKTIENHRYNICKKLDLPREKNSLLHFILTKKDVFVS